MAARPHDFTDLYLVPVLLDLDARLGEFENLSPKEVDLRVTVSTDLEPRNAVERAELLLRSVTHALDVHGWDVSWAPRGLRISHDDHGLVLGIPESIRTYLRS